MRGDRWVGRVSESMLKTVGLPELVAANREDYRRLAVTLAGDIPRLTQLRATLRHRLLISPLCDSRAFTNDLESRYQQMWQDWCGLQNQTSISGPDAIAFSY